MKKRDYSEELNKLVDNTNYINVEVNDELKKSFIAYAMAVNVTRAIPDVRDGLKPVHRRILYAMGEINLFSDKPYKKCARIVGEVLGKYHPHGDTSVYDALVRLAQDFSIRCPLVDGHGNFGSVDGDPPAAMRYTEARLSSISNEMLRDIDKDTIDFYPNFDDTQKQPVVLPSRFPNLLVNGSDGIAVGMATNIPPHNLGEVIEGVDALIDNPDITVEELLQIIKGPDFPTGAIVMGRSAILKAYKTGRGNLIVRSKTEIEEDENGKASIIIDELPYQVNKAKLIEQIANQVKDKKIEGISDIKEESDRHGMRIVIDVKREYQPNVVLNNLFKHTDLQVSQSVIFLALVDGEPKILSLKEILEQYLIFQKQVITRRTKFDLEKAKERAHIIEGLVIALANIDEVIKVIKQSREKDEAIVNLCKSFNLSEKQAQAILDMRLQRLTALEVEKLNEELALLKTQIIDLQDILDKPQRVVEIIKKEMNEIKEKYDTPRRTQICETYEDIEDADLIPVEDDVISMTHGGYIKRLALSEYRSQHRGGIGVTAQTMKEEDFVDNMFVASSHDDILFFTNLGKVYCIKAYEIPEAQRVSKGRAIVNLLNLAENEKATTIIKRNSSTNGYFVMATKNGLIKKTKVSEFDSIRITGKIAIVLREGDELIDVDSVSDDDNVIIASSSGKCINFNVKNVRESSRVSQGVKSIAISKDEAVVSMAVVHKDAEILTVSELGYGKRTPVSEYKEQGRGGKGCKAGNFNEKTGKLVCLKEIADDKDIIMITSSGIMLRTKATDIRVIGRATTGVILMKIKDDSKIVSVAIADKEEDKPEVENQEEENNETKQEEPKPTQNVEEQKEDKPTVSFATSVQSFGLAQNLDKVDTNTIIENNEQNVKQEDHSSALDDFLEEETSKDKKDDDNKDDDSDF
jgi:DNA gyrase subunit A